MSEKEYVFVGNAQLKTRDYIRQLETENKRLNNIIKLKDTRNSRQRIANKKLLERNQDLVIENLKLNNIINEFEILIENEINESKLEDDYDRADSLDYCLSTLKELKGRDKE